MIWLTWRQQRTETLIAGREEVWLTHFYRSWSCDPNMLSPEGIDVYVRAYVMRAVLSGRGDEVIDLAATNLLPR